MSAVDPAPVGRGVRTRGLGWSMLWAVVLFLVTNLGALLTNYLTTVFVTPLQTAAVSTGVSLLVVLVGVAVDHVKGRQPTDTAPRPGTVPAGSTPYQQPYPSQPYPSQPYPSQPYSGQPYPSQPYPGQPYPGQPYPGQPYAGRAQPGQPYPKPYPGQPRAVAVRRGNRTVSWLTAILLVLLLCGGGGFAATLGVQWAIGTVTGLVDPAGVSDPAGASGQAGDPRLVREVSSSAGVLTVTVTGVRTTGQFTLIDLLAANSGSETLIMPVFGRTQLAVPGAATLEGDPFRSKWAGSSSCRR